MPGFRLTDAHRDYLAAFDELLLRAHTPNDVAAARAVMKTALDEMRADAAATGPKFEPRDSDIDIRIANLELARAA